MSIKRALFRVGVVFAAAALSAGCGGSKVAAVSGGGGAAGSFTDDRNGREYRTVQIGGQTWMAENLSYETGTSWCYDNNESNCAKYGRLYDWETAASACPSGWRLPSRDEWNALIETAGGENVAGAKLKSKSGWKGSGKGTDNFGFSALPGGERSVFERDPRNISAAFLNLGNLGRWWSATGSGEGRAYGRYMLSGKEDGEYGYRTITGLSVRCVQGETEAFQGDSEEDEMQGDAEEDPTEMQGDSPPDED
ncbi:MAG: fibrobacter succinogenes major paralogous domain-containing protein [Chitinispirillales bacterium]|jgi:uncharacterized protein (TIGR02145 family)|nr:fibrobacter succinogenes major paralogous domain-containing protein [Chitinispirillales bacterium]